MAGALAFSLNCASAYIMKQVGPAQFANFLERLNIPTRVDPVPSLALGACDLSLYEMMWAYSIFPGHGFSTRPYFISRIEDRNGNIIKRFDYSSNRKEAISEVTAYNMTRMMEGPVTRGTAAGLMQRLGAVEMGGKTGTTNDNADAWFMGYVPQMIAGAWIGCDDRFIRIESGEGFGGQAARPIWESFFKKIYADKTLGVDKEARFAKPADLMNESNNADISSIIEESVTPGAESEDVGVGDANDFGTQDTTQEYIPAESQAPDDDTKKEKTKAKDSADRKESKIGDPAPANEKKKKGFFKKIFGSKKEESANDY